MISYSTPRLCIKARYLHVLLCTCKPNPGLEQTRLRAVERIKTQWTGGMTYIVHVVYE